MSTTTTTTTSRTLLSLPSELVEQILDNVPPSTLPAVRQTCKTLASLSANSFGSKVLAQVSVVMAREALEGVISLLSYEVFGTFVQRLDFFSPLGWKRGLRCSWRRSGRGGSIGGRPRIAFSKTTPLRHNSELRIHRTPSLSRHVTNREHHSSSQELIKCVSI